MALAGSTNPSDHEPTWQVPARLRLELLAWLSAAPQQPALMSYDEFLEWADEDTLAEWVKGSVVMASPASLEHQDLALFLGSVLSAYVAAKDLGKIIVAPFQMKLPDSGREPDVIYLAPEHMARLRQTYVDGPGDLVVEIVSPESQGRDRGDKFYEYQQGGVLEYWLLDPADQRAEFYQRDEHGIYQQVAPDADGVYHARALPGFWLKLSWLWQDPLPAVEDVVLSVAGQAYAHALIDRLRRKGFLDQP
ncbi:MAG TPA: Uma2 family endonuclease [Ktedonobacterales bacterium]|nr:Uma2 family endonuclease [Ktedonobacterales bacterium]